MIVNRHNHISTKEECKYLWYDKDEALTDKENEYQVSEVEKELMKKYKKIFKKINKNIFFAA